MPLFQGFRPVAGTICPSRAAAVVGPSRAPQGMKKGRRPRRRPRLKLSDKAGPDQCPVPGENALFPAQIAGFLAVSRPVPVYPVFLKYVVPVHCCYQYYFSMFSSCIQYFVALSLLILRIRFQSILRIFSLKYPIRQEISFFIYCPFQFFNKASFPLTEK